MDEKQVAAWGKALEVLLRHREHGRTPLAGKSIAKDRKNQDGKRADWLDLQALRILDPLLELRAVEPLEARGVLLSA